MNNELTKKEVARRQLITAINLFFDFGDSVSIFSLAANAWEIIDVLCNKTGIESISNNTRENVPQGKDLKYDYINSPYRNYFKHADRDPEEVLHEFKEENVDSILFLGVEDYIRLYNKSPIEFQVFQLWYIATNTEKLCESSFTEILKTLNTALPDIQKLSRREQILMGKEFLINATKNKEIINDKCTETSL